MAMPIQPTPTLTGDDAVALQASLSEVATPAEVKRRRDAARAYIAAVMRPKPRR